MKMLILAVAFALALPTLASASSKLARPEIGVAAPAFNGLTSDGATISLADFAGDIVVLEWTNNGCPFVKKHYNGGNMQKSQAAANDLGAVWISIISSAPGKQGYISADEANAEKTARGASPDHIVFDSSGDIGRAYGARTTPQMFVIDETGILRYAGAIDDKPSTRPSSLEGAINYTLAALNAVVEGREVETPSTKPYGCSVKY